jgi:hypothetical protein
MPKTKVYCPSCGRSVETETIVRTGPGAARTLSAAPGEMTLCACRKMLVYGGKPGKLTVKLALPDRIHAFRKLEREGPAHLQLSSVVEYVRKFRSMPDEEPGRITGRAHFTSRALHP